MSPIFTEIDILFVVCVIYWSLPTSGSPQEIAWNGPKLVYDCAVWVGAVMVLILCLPLLGIYIKLICIVFMECLLELVNSTPASGWWCRSKHPGDFAVEFELQPRLKTLQNYRERTEEAHIILWGSKVTQRNMTKLVWISVGFRMTLFNSSPQCLFTVNTFARISVRHVMWPI